MNISEIKDLMAQFDQSSLREFSYKTQTDELNFSKNKPVAGQTTPIMPISQTEFSQVEVAPAEQIATNETKSVPDADIETPVVAEGEVVESPLVGVVYLAPAPDKPSFVEVGDTVKKGQTLMIIEAMKVMNEVPAPSDGVVTEILVANEEVVDFGKGLVRIK